MTDLQKTSTVSLMEVERLRKLAEKVEEENKVLQKKLSVGKKEGSDEETIESLEKKLADLKKQRPEGSTEGAPAPVFVAPAAPVAPPTQPLIDQPTQETEENQFEVKMRQFLTEARIKKQQLKVILRRGARRTAHRVGALMHRIEEATYASNESEWDSPTSEAMHQLQQEKDELKKQLAKSESERKALRDAKDVATSLLKKAEKERDELKNTVKDLISIGTKAETDKCRLQFLYDQVLAQQQRDRQEYDTVLENLRTKLVTKAAAENPLAEAEGIKKKEQEVVEQMGKEEEKLEAEKEDADFEHIHSDEDQKADSETDWESVSN